MASNKDAVFKLMKEKETIEDTLKELWEVLKSNNIGLQEPVVDREGYPRADIDVYQVQHARHRIRCLQNDHTAIMKEIEAGLEKVHAEARASQQVDPDGANVASEEHIHFESFCKIDQVVPGSPADLGGLKVNDLVIKFGSVSNENFENLSSVGRVVQHSQNSPIKVTVQRQGKNVTLTVTPRVWSGKGLLGCNLVPLDKPDR
ncbi:26S proteasome non-ATPase regulatory subunit 9 [Oratosquilla oratoria]|uniref:26S proteasome non-ATPase regulatory subunit 9 n=1 Tax=Oratosquilla oratoria TaxID=337810 RepID=UPI003F771430